MTPVFSQPIDYFNMAGDVLEPISSDEGTRADITRIAECVNYVRSSVSAQVANPSTTYAVKDEGTISFKLGTAYSVGGKKYMLTEVRVSSANGQFPRVTFTGTANEGSDACATQEFAPWSAEARAWAEENKDYLLLPDGDWTDADRKLAEVYGLELPERTVWNQSPKITIALSPSLFAIDPAGAFSGGLVSCDTTWKCESVIVWRGGEIIASDIKGPMVTVSGEWYEAPTVKSGFTLSGKTKRGSSGAYDTVSVEVEKYL